MKTFWRVILSLSVMGARGVAHSHLFWRGCRLSSVNGSRRVRSLWLFYMQASVSWTWCEFKHVLYASWLPAGGFNSWDGGGGGCKNAHLSLNLSVCIYINSHIYVHMWVYVCVRIWVKSDFLSQPGMTGKTPKTFCGLTRFEVSFHPHFKWKHCTMQWDLTVLYNVVSC